MSQNHNQRDSRIPREPAPAPVQAAGQPPLPPQAQQAQPEQQQQQETDRTPRAFETREQFTRPDTWQPPDMLPMPNERPGWTHRYVRTALLGADDPTNVNKAIREGFEPCRAADYPEIMAMTDPSSRFPDSIEIGGLILCRAPTEFMEQRKKHYEKQTAMQQQTVDNDLMRQNDARMPMLAPDRKSKVTFGSGG